MDLEAIHLKIILKYIFNREKAQYLIAQYHIEITFYAHIFLFPSGAVLWYLQWHIC